MIRYSDVVLMAAEAACEMGGEAMIEEALDYLEQVRARARGTNTNVLPKVTTTNQLELCKAIHHERHVELALEFDRFYDLVRWQEFSIAGAEDGALAVLGNKGLHRQEQIPAAASGAGRRLERRAGTESRLC